MKKAILAVWLCWAAMQAGAAGKLEWLTDLPQAQSKAKAEHKLVLMDFTGSDWCTWCLKLDKEVFDTRQFAEYAAKNLVLVEVDFPNKKPQPEELKKANQLLQEKYKVEGYPTIIVLDGDGKKVGELGYEPGGPKVFIGKLAELKKS